MFLARIIIPEEEVSIETTTSEGGGNGNNEEGGEENAQHQNRGFLSGLTGAVVGVIGSTEELWVLLDIICKTLENTTSNRDFMGVRNMLT